MAEGEPIAGELRCRSMTNGTLIELPPITLAISNAVSAPPGHVHVLYLLYRQNSVDPASCGPGGVVMVARDVVEFLHVTRFNLGSPSTAKMI
jgi:hypothetical protein